ncbi:MAG: hypothetical protein FH748_01175 [Balneolaceae bacterium]|nr:hypothetical protein [Balneolaceae bacterium]
MNTNINFSKLLIFFFCLLFSSQANAQSITLTGIITAKSSGQPLGMANVSLQSLENNAVQGTATDNNGLYHFSTVTAGKYIFHVSYVGYKTHIDTLNISWTKEKYVHSVALEEDELDLDELYITDNRRKQDLDAGQQKISRTELKRVPTPAGSGDLASYLLTLPGVVATGDRGGQFFVRGGTPSQNLTLLDGAIVYRPFHIVGFFSVFPEKAVSNVDFYAGGFGPEYNSRTSSVLDVRLRNGNYNEHKVSASVSPFVSEIFAEGPLKKGKSSFMILGRGSLIEQASQLYPSGQQPLRFNSQLIKISNKTNNGGNCSTIFMRTYDRGKLDYEYGNSFSWKNFVLGERCIGISESSSVSFTELNVSVSRSVNQVGTEENPERYSNITNFNTKLNLTQFVKEVRLDYGFFTNLRWLSHDISDLLFNTQEDENVFITSGAYIKTMFKIGETLEIQPGISGSVFLKKFKPSIEPRLQLSWHPRQKPSEELNASIGLYTQPIAGITDFRDAGSSFSAWMPIPKGNAQMQAVHAVLGWRQPIGNFLDVSVEGYYKWLKNTPIAAWSTFAKFGTQLELAEGTVEGIDVQLKYNRDHFYTSLGYGYSTTEYETEQSNFTTWFGVEKQKYHPGHDRRHQLNAQMGINIKGFSFNMNWKYGSGLPYTQPYGFDSYLEYNDLLPDVTNEYGSPRALIDKPFNNRLPDFHTLNISLEQIFKLSSAQISLQAGAINTYNQNNIFYYDIYRHRRIDQLPFYPYMSLKMETL